MQDNECDEILDLMGLKCPYPVLKTRKALEALPAGSIIKVLTTDPMAKVDITHYCSQAGHELIRRDDLDDRQVFLIRRG
jgi:tRNA 2-thiouridine synthesizing protein A